MKSRVAQELIADGSFPIHSVTYANTLAADPEASDATIHMVVGHGAWGGPTTMAPLMRQALRAADANGQAATATVYRDPFFGFNGYHKADRAERFDRVVRATAARTDQPVHLVGHSWAGAESLEIAGRAQREELAASFIAYTLANRITDDKMTFQEFMFSGLREIRHGDGVAGPRSLVTIGAVGVGAIMHGIPALPTAVRECADTFDTRLTPQLIKLSQTLPTGVVLAGHDEFFGHGIDGHAYLREAGFDGAIGILEGATHMGAVSNPHNGDMLYGTLDAVMHPDSQINANYYS